ncbi:hypothetical protein ABZ540_31405 [Nocardia xishanensis]
MTHPNPQAPDANGGPHLDGDEMLPPQPGQPVALGGEVGERAGDER